MHKLLLLSLAVGLAFVGMAKQSPEGERKDPFANKVAVALYPSDYLPLPYSTEAILRYLQQQLPHLQHPATTLVLDAHKTSPGGQHFTLHQTYEGVPVFNSQVKINLGKDGKVYSIFDNSYKVNNWPSLATDAATMQAVDLGAVAISRAGVSEPQLSQDISIAVIDLKPGVYKQIDLFHLNSGTHRLYLIAKNGSVVYDKSLVANSSAPVTGYVFNPDPLTSAGVPYGTPYVDSSDANTLVLLNQRKLVTFEADLDGAIYYLRNNHFTMADFSSPNQVVTTSLTPAFLFNRSQDGFEEVNAFYHLTRFQEYVDSLGFSTLTEDTLQVDAHALNGSDNSQFSYGGGFLRLFFGDGNVDDAEDADVVIHEYGHGLSYAGSPVTNFGNYREALDEGFGDYFAASYSRHLSSYRWEDVFTWDGHNEFWSGRDAATTKVYPTNLSSSIHRNGEMWATALMEVWSALGRENADKLALQTLFYLAANMTFTDAANAYLQADNACFGGANYNLIYTIMDNRGFFDPIGLDEAKAAAPLLSFALYNSWAFTTNGEDANIRNFTGEPFSYTVYDVSGKAVYQSAELQTEQQPIHAADLAPGTYLIKVRGNGQEQVFRLVR